MDEHAILEQFSDAVAEMLNVNAEHNRLEPSMAIFACAAGLSKYVAVVAGEGDAPALLREVRDMVAERFTEIADKWAAYEAASPEERRRMDAAASLTNTAPAGRA